MSNETSTKKGVITAAAPATPAQVADFIVAKLDGKFLRFTSLDKVPEGERPVTLSTLKGLDVSKLGSIYADIAGVAPKNFKNTRDAIESISYQAGKIPLYDPHAPSKPGVKSAKGPKVSGGAKIEPKMKSVVTYDLLTPENTKEAVESLAPQARELITIMVGLAKEKGTSSFTEAELQAKLAIPEVAATLKTRQPPVRILQYYKSKLVSSGLVKVS